MVKKINTNTAEWGNIELPGFGDDKLLSPNINIILANKAKASDPKIKAKLSKSTQASLKKPEVQQARAKAARKGGDTKANSVEYQQLMTEVNRKKAQDPDFSIKDSIAIKKKWTDPDYQAKQLEKARKQGKPIKDPNGKIWPSRTEAAKAWNLHPRDQVGRWAKAGKNGWSYDI
jgi:hypothetical protein